MKKSILITGCSSGIGYAVAKGLQARAYRVFATARKAEDVQRLSNEGLESLQLNLADTASIHAAVDEVLSRTGGTLDALFNNGAYGQPGAVEDLQTDILREQFEVNFFAWHELNRLILPVMRKQGYGRIIQNSSVLGLIALRYRGAYNASKYALEGLTDTLRMELAGSHIHISLIEPGPIRSRFRANAYVALKRNINIENSPHREDYRAAEKRLSKAEGDDPPFTLPPEAILKKVIHALESHKPKVRYYVTFPTYVFAFLKRILPHSVLDSVLLWISRRESR